MSEELGGMEDLLLGNNAEKASLSPKELSDRANAAAAAMKKLKKEEKKAKKSDTELVKVLKTLDFETIKVVSGMITAGVSSLVILSVLTLTNEDAKAYVAAQFADFVQEWAHINNAKKKTNLGSWWTYMIMADHLSEPSQIAKTDMKKDAFDKILAFFLKSHYQNAIPDDALAFYDKYHGFLFPKSDQND